jgi:hypothetical protein
MTWDSSRSWPVRGKLARHLGRLQQHLDAAGEQVREAVATAVGRTVAEAVGEAVFDALAPFVEPSGYSYAYDTYDDADSGYSSSLRDEPRSRRRRRAMAAGLQAAAWWLRRHSGQVSLMAALAVGTVAGLAVLASHVSALATLMMSALGLAYLLDLVRLSRSLLDGDARI